MIPARKKLRRLYRRARRAPTPRVTYLDLNHDPSRTLLLASSGRSGSTWLSEALSEGIGCRTIFEPLRRDFVPLSRGVRWGQYLDPDGADPAVEDVVTKVLEGRVRSRWSDKFNTARLPRRRLVKEIRATNLLPWVAARYPDTPVVYLLRHPVACSLSAAALNWKPFLGEFYAQPSLMEGPLGPFADYVHETEAGGDLLTAHVLRWCMENFVPVNMLERGSVHVVFYEDMVADPANELSRLNAFMERFDVAWPGVTMSSSAERRASRTNYRKTDVSGGADKLARWTETLSPASLARACEIVERFGLGRVYGAGVRPLVAADELLSARQPARGPTLR